jgi:hypothetical protein
MLLTIESASASSVCAREQPVRVVLEDQQVVFVGDLQQPSAGRDVEGVAGRVGEVGHDVKRAWPQAAGAGRGGRHSHPLGVQSARGLGYGHDVDVEQAGRAGEADVARRRGEHDIARRGTQGA